MKKWDTSFRSEFESSFFSQFLTLNLHLKWARSCPKSIKDNSCNVLPLFHPSLPLLFQSSLGLCTDWCFLAPNCTKRTIFHWCAFLFCNSMNRWARARLSSDWQLSQFGLLWSKILAGRPILFLETIKSEIQKGLDCKQKNWFSILYKIKILYFELANKFELFFFYHRYECKYLNVCYVITILCKFKINRSAWKNSIIFEYRKWGRFHSIVKVVRTTSSLEFRD